MKGTAVLTTQETGAALLVSSVSFSSVPAVLMSPCPHLALCPTSAGVGDGGGGRGELFAFLKTYFRCHLLCATGCGLLWGVTSNLVT